MRNDRTGAVWTGIVLIGLGVILAIAQLGGWDKIWPIFPLFVGVALLVSYGLGRFRDGGLAFLGTAATLIGLFFFGFTLGFWEWGDMENLWPVFPIIGGLAFIVLFFAERRTGRDWGVLGVGLAAIIVGVIAIAAKQGMLPEDIWKYWPVLLIMVGLFALVGGLLTRSRKS